MTYRARNDKDLLALLSHYERTVADYMRAKYKGDMARRVARLAYMGASAKLLDYIETTVNDAFVEGISSEENNRDN